MVIILMFMFKGSGLINKPIGLIIKANTFTSLILFCIIISINILNIVIYGIII